MSEENANYEVLTADDISRELAQQTTKNENAPAMKANPYVGIAQSPFSAEAVEALLQAIPDTDVEIRPDGLIYLPEIKYRRILNKAFGPGAWAMLPIDITVSPDDNMLYYRGAMIVHGRFIAESIGEQQYFPKNDRMSYATAAESAKSNCLMRCCKDLGIASQLWDPSFVRQWLATYAVEVWCENIGHNPSDRGKKRKLWRRKDAPAIDMFPWREDGAGEQQERPAGRPGAKQESRHQLPAGDQSAPKGNSNPAIITFRQAKRFRAIASEFGWLPDEFAAYLDTLGYPNPENIRRADYDRICAGLEDSELHSRIVAGMKRKEVSE